MAKALRESTYLNSLFSAGLFKKNQGRLARLWTWIVVTTAVVWGAWTLQARLLVESGDLIRIGVPTLVVLAGAWAAFRLVHFPRFADFLIDVEGEMGKVSWPGWGELWRATVVVLITMFLFSVVLFGYDMLWQYFLRWCSILQA